MQKQVSLETAKKLVEAGVVLETEKQYVDDKLTFVGYDFFHNKIFKGVPAPDIAELLEALPGSVAVLECGESIYYWLWITKDKDDSYYEVRYSNWNHQKAWVIKQNEYLVEALAECLLWVKKEGGKNGKG